MRLYTRYHLTRAKWLGHVIIGSKSKSTDLVDVVFFCGNHDDRRIFHLAEPSADFKSVHARKHQIQDQKIKIFV